MINAYKKVRAGFEPAHQRFAVTCLTTWLPDRQILKPGAVGIEPTQLFKVDLRLANGYLNHSVTPPKILDSSTGASVS